MNGSKFPYATLERDAVDAAMPPPAVRGSSPPSRAVRANRRRILVLAQLPPPEHGAAAVNRQVVNSRLLSETFDLAVVPIAMSADLARLRKFDLMKIGRSLRLFGTVTGWLFGRSRPDAVYFTLSPAGWAFYRDLALVTLIRLAGVRCVFHLHGRGVAASIDRAPWRRHLYRFAFARAYVITLGGTLRDDIKDLASDDRIFEVPNGIGDTACPQWHPRQDLNARRGNDRPPRILFLSNMLKEKGPLVLLEALAMVAEQGVRFEAQFVGAWRPPISEELFAARVHALGLKDFVTLPGPVYGEAKNRLFADTDLFVMPTYYRHEALPLAVIEAMMHGRAIITTTVGALPEIISDQESGELVKPGNVADLASALEKLLINPELRERYGRAARLKYESDLTAQRFEERLREVLLHVSRNPA
jgi:glycosyltransferase involved in cell wall biosynthesis